MIKTLLHVTAITSFLFLASCSEYGSKISSQYIGERLINLVGDDPRIAPPPGSIKEIFPECKFEKDSDEVYTLSKKCEVKKTSALLHKNEKQDISITANTPRCCMTSVLISQEKIDPTGTGMRLFDGLKGVELKPLVCDPDDTFQKIYIVEKDSKPKFIITEHVSYGSAGTTIDTVIDFGKVALDCENIKTQSHLFKVQRDYAQGFNARALTDSNPQKTPDILNDPKTGMSINYGSLAGKSGGCLAHLNTIGKRNPQSFEHITNNFNQSQKVWVGNQVVLLNKIRKASPNMTAFEALKSGLISKEEAEWSIGYMVFMNGLLNSDITQISLSYLAACEDAGLIKLP
jgi:hypothetical protein